jgi:DNA-binding PucR family transcriptional regulator
MIQSMSSIVEILTNSVFRDGKATKVLTEPLLRWLAGRGTQIVNKAIHSKRARRPERIVQNAYVVSLITLLLDEDAESDELNAVSKLVEALIEHSAGWMAGKLDQADVQSFLGLLLSLTGFPGLPGRDENVSEVSHRTYVPLFVSE